jgi:poly(A) polymerase
MNSLNIKTKAEIYKKSEHRLQTSKIDIEALKIIHRLNRAGHVAYIVGGGVRDLLLNKAPKDFDIATNATPKEIKNLFRNCRIIGRRFKLAHIFFRGNKIIEVSTFRDFSTEPNDDSTESDKLLANDNIYGDERSDAIRRDLTINALFYNPINHTIIDYVGGLKDLRHGVIRIIGDPEIRFQEDPIRMIRALRHASRTNFQIAEDCLTAINKYHHLIEKCPAMRLYEEIKKDMLSGCFLGTLQLMQQHHVLQHLLPKLSAGMAKELWQHNSYFLQSIANADIHLKEYGENSITALLAVLVLFSQNLNFSKAHFLDEEFNQEILKENIQEAFQHFAVPRKEKEKILIVIRQAQARIINQKNTTRSRLKDDLRSDINHLLSYLGLKRFETEYSSESIPKKKSQTFRLRLPKDKKYRGGK